MQNKCLSKNSYQMVYVCLWVCCVWLGMYQSILAYACIGFKVLAHEVGAIMFVLCMQLFESLVECLKG